MGLEDPEKGMRVRRDKNKRNYEEGELKGLKIFNFVGRKLKLEKKRIKVSEVSNKVV